MEEITHQPATLPGAGIGGEKLKSMSRNQLIKQWAELTAAYFFEFSPVKAWELLRERDTVNEQLDQLRKAEATAEVEKYTIA